MLESVSKPLAPQMQAATPTPVGMVGPEKSVGYTIDAVVGATATSELIGAEPRRGVASGINNQASTAMILHHKAS